MAKTWTIREAYEAIKAGDKDAIADFGKRFPLVTTALAQAGHNEGLDAFMNALPDRVTTRTVEMVLKEGVQPVDEDEVEEVAEEKPVKGNKKSAKAEKSAKKGKKADPEPEEDDDDEEVEEDDEVVEEEEVEEIDYSSMNAVELFKECKKRKLKVEPKQKASVYIKALKADDEANASDEDADEDWDDEEEEVEEKPTKKSAKTAKATKSAKSAKKSKADDDDDEWDI